MRQRSRQREFLCSTDGESVSTVVVLFVTTVALALSALHEPPYTEPYVRWCGRTAEGDSASYPIGVHYRLKIDRSLGSIVSDDLLYRTWESDIIAVESRLQARKLDSESCPGFQTSCEKGR